MVRDPGTSFFVSVSSPRLASVWLAYSARVTGSCVVGKMEMIEGRI